MIARLGSGPRELGRLGSSRALAGNGLVLKAGPPDRAAREAFVLGEIGSLPVRVPTLVDAGRGWLLLRTVEIADADVAPWQEEALADLARLHETFVGDPVLDDGRFRDVTGAELTGLQKQSARLAVELDLPEPLRVLAADLEPLLGELRGQTTIVHGDAWPGNVLPTADGGRCWIDWEEAGVGHPALDLANWLHGSPWVPPSADPDRDLAAYLAARTTALDAAEFRRAVDAAVVLLFLLLDLPGLARWDNQARREILGRRAATARRFS